MFYIYIYIWYCILYRGTWKHSFLRHYATSEKVASSVADEVVEVFSLPNPSICTVALELTQPITGMRTKILAGVMCSQCLRLTTSLQSINWLSRKSGILNFLQSYRPPWPVYDALTVTISRTWTWHSCSDTCLDNSPTCWKWRCDGKQCSRFCLHSNLLLKVDKKLNLQFYSFSVTSVLRGVHSEFSKSYEDDSIIKTVVRSGSQL
jgi:hypothetical protein